MGRHGLGLVDWRKTWPDAVMANAVFIQNPTSIYDDQPGVAYHFPKRYLSVVEACIGDWVVFWEGRKGAFAYTSVQKVEAVTEDPDRPDHYYAWLASETLWQFESHVPRNAPSGRAWEASLRRPDGRAMSGGASVSAVRRISFDEFSEIVTAGLNPLTGPDALPRDGALQHGMEEAAAPFQHAPIADIRATVLASRAARDQSFARLVKLAYGGRCAISGLDLRNGLGRAEVQAAHIRPVAEKGPDIVPNGLALSATVHWMFDRGLIAVADDHTILVSDNKVPRDVAERLISPERRLHLPEAPRDRPHPTYLAYHRVHKFGAAA